MKLITPKKTRVAFLMLFLILEIKSFAQKSGNIGIGTTQPDQSAILDLSADDKGLLLPRLSLDQRMNIKNPASGLMVYQTNLLSGLYVYSGNQWQAVSGAATEAKLVSADNSVWGTGGNAGLNSNLNFIGTTDTTSLVFKVNDVRSGIIDYKRGNTILGYKAASSANPYNSVIFGSLAMQKNNTVGNTIAMGFQALFSHEAGDHNIAIGSGSLAANSGGEKNTAVGSLSGYKSQGSRNVFIGYQAGYFEQESDKLHISNDASKAPLIYGDFANAKLGINTTNLSHTLNINSGTVGKSGLKFENFTNTSPTVSSNKKVLSVNSAGEVVLVNDSEGSNFWTASGVNMTNSNTGFVKINNDLNVGKNLSVTESISSKGITLGASGLKFNNLNNSSPAISGNSKVLSLDANGNVILVNDQVASGTTTTPVYTGGTDANWASDANGNISNLNSGDVNISNKLNIRDISTFNLTVGWGGIHFKELSSNNPAYASNGKCLSLDELGNFILTNLPDGVGTSSSGGNWSLSNNVVYSNPGSKVVIGGSDTPLPDGYNLYVRKGILAERVRVAISGSEKWADYVFADNYKLMPLKDVETYVKKEKHLPNVLSADEIAIDGIDLAEIASKQMEKIEELTLYLIDATKRIEVLEKQLAQK